MFDGKTIYYDTKYGGLLIFIHALQYGSVINHIGGT